MSLIYTSVDIMSETKDLLDNPDAQTKIDALTFAISRDLKVDSVSISVPINTSAEATAARGTPFAIEPAAYALRFASSIHALGMKVQHRPTDCWFEGIYTFPQKVGPSRLPTGTVASAPTDGAATWLGRFYAYIVNNPTLFENGDIWAPLPEATGRGIFSDSTSFLPYSSPGIQQNYADFFNDLKTVSETAFAAIGKSGVICGLSAQNASEALSGWYKPDLFAHIPVIPVDHYGTDGAGHSPTEMLNDLRAIKARYGKPVYLQEWGDYWSLDVAHTNPVRNQAQHEAYLQSMYDAFQELIDEGTLVGFNYWRVLGGFEKIMTDVDATSGFNYELNYAGIKLQEFLDPIVATPTITPPGATFQNSQTVVLATETLGAQIYYTTDDSNPIAGPELPHFGPGLSGLEFGSGNGGVEGIDYFQPSAQDFLDIKAAGFDMARLAVTAERLQPIVSGGLDDTYAGYISAAFDNAAAAGIELILDFHNFGRRHALGEGGFVSFFHTDDPMWAGGSVFGDVLNVNDFASAIAGHPENGTCILTADISMSSRFTGDAWNAAWLQFFRTDANNFLAVTLHAVDNHWELVKRVNGTDTIITSGSMTFNLNTPYTVTVDVGHTSAGNIKVTIGGSLITTQAIPSGFTKGQIGLFNNGVVASIDNVTLNVNGDTTGGLTGTGYFAVDDGGPVTHDTWADTCVKAVAEWGSHAAWLSIDIMNEWHDMPVPLTPSTLLTATSSVTNQACIDALEAAGYTKDIVIEFDSYSNLHKGPGHADGLVGVNPDPWWHGTVCRIIPSWHHYFDPNHTGSDYTTFTQDLLDRVAGEVTPTMEWCRNHGLVPYIGETGTPPDDPGYLSCLYAAMLIWAQYGAWVSPWAMGDFYSAITKVTPSNPLGQMSIYSQFMNPNGLSPSAIAYTAPFAVTHTSTVKAIALKTGLQASAIVSAVFTNQIAARVWNKTARRTNNIWRPVVRDS